eukprot:3941554-Rhodomonas_salina.6
MELHAIGTELAYGATGERAATLRQGGPYCPWYAITLLYDGTNLRHPTSPYDTFSAQAGPAVLPLHPISTLLYAPIPSYPIAPYPITGSVLLLVCYLPAP